MQLLLIQSKRMRFILTSTEYISILVNAVNNITHKITSSASFFQEVPDG